MCVKAFAEALEIVPYTLAENGGLNPIHVVTELRNKHAQGLQNSGIGLKRNWIVDDMHLENVIQPALITESALRLSTECIRMILKIDDVIVNGAYA